VAKIRYENVLAAFLTDLNGKYKPPVMELTLERAAMSASTIMWVPGFTLSPLAI
jgi:hypothetical protein